MRALLVATLMLIAALAGCSGKSDGHLHVECADGKEIHEDDYEDALPENATEEDILDFLRTKCTGSSSTGTRTSTRTNTTAQAPNVLPKLALNITDAGGNVTNVTMLGGNLTFSAAGSSDPDGQVSAIAISVDDGNSTRTRSLYDANSKTFTPAEFNFDRPGIVNVTVAMVDDRAGFNTSTFNVFVNHPQTVNGGTKDGPVQNGPHSDPCLGARPALGQQGPILDNQYFSTQTIAVVAAASFIEVIPNNANTRVTICDPDGNPISATKASGPTSSTNTERLAPATGVSAYSIGMYANSPRTPLGAAVIVHYEPRAAATE